MFPQRVCGRLICTVVEFCLVVFLQPDTAKIWAGSEWAEREYGLAGLGLSLLSLARSPAGSRKSSCKGKEKEFDFSKEQIGNRQILSYETLNKLMAEGPRTSERGGLEFSTTTSPCPELLFQTYTLEGVDLGTLSWDQCHHTQQPAVGTLLNSVCSAPVGQCPHTQLSTALAEERQRQRAASAGFSCQHPDCSPVLPAFHF